MEAEDGAVGEVKDGVAPGPETVHSATYLRGRGQDGFSAEAVAGGFTGILGWQDTISLILGGVSGATGIPIVTIITRPLLLRTTKFSILSKDYSFLRIPLSC